MIDWHHPRIYERLRCFGLALFTLGIASHNIDSPAISLTALVVTGMLVYRLKIELAIEHDEEERKLAAKLQRIGVINRWIVLPIMIGLLGFMRKVNDS
jgi:hypothetical protein